jgi:sterol desaturase/sphingolipid hydroxylase (fatty acid hydroxylase superfamily)
MAQKRLEQLRLRFGEGTISIIISLLLSTLCFLGVLAFHFPEYLTTPELRNVYSDSFARSLMAIGILFSLFFALLNIILSKKIYLAGISFCIIVVTLLLGGTSVPVATINPKTVYFGLDFLILDLLASALIFIAIEKFFGYNKKQLIFRKEWGTDLFYFICNHVFIGIFLLIVTHFVSTFSFAISQNLQLYIRSLHSLVQFIIILFVTDFIQYWSHRAYHEVPFLWYIHAIHHSSKQMDWLASSRLHILELLITRSLIFLPIFLLGFDTHVINAYIIYVSFQAVFDHANVSVNPGILRYIIVTPNFHHWHHSQDQEALDKNYAAHFSCIDYMFGTAVNSQKMWPEKYGVLGDYVPTGFIKQFTFPFGADYRLFKNQPQEKNN